MTVGERLKNIRIDRGLSQREFGKLIGKCYTGVSKIESNKQELTATDLITICDRLGISIIDLIPISNDHLFTEFEKRESFINEFYGG